MKNGGVRRAQTVAAAGQALRKKFTYLGGSIRGDSHKLKADYGEGTVNRMASVLKNFSKRDKARLQASRSVDEVIGGTDTIRPLRPASSDRPLLQTTFQSPSKESITTPLETIVGSPIDDTRALTGLPPVRPRRKRRSSLSDLQPVKDAETVNLLDRNNPIYDRIPMRPSAPPPPDTSRGPVPIRKGSKTGGIRIGTPPVPPESPTPAPGSRRDQRERAMMFDRKENVSRNAVSRPAKPSSNQALRPTGSSHVCSSPGLGQTEILIECLSTQLRERISVERNFPTENDLALQREIREMNKIGEELRGGSQSRGAGSTAPSSVASSASSAYATSHPTSAASSSYDDYRRLHTRGSSSEISQDLKVAFEYRAELHNREEKIKDMEAEMARKDMEVQTLRAEVRRKDAGIAQREQAQKEQTQKEKLQRREADIAKIEAEYRKREETYKAEIRKRDEEISKKQAEFIRKADEHRAELRKRDKAMRNLNRLYDEINAEQDELYKRCNDEIEAIARASAAIGSGALGGNGQSDLYRTLQDSYTKEGVMRQEIM